MGDGVVCRDARLDDHAALARIFLDCRRLTFHWLSPETLSLDDLARETVGERIVVAEDDAGRLLGFVAVWEPDRFVHHLFVDPAHQRTGVGTRLLETLRAGAPLPYRLKCVAANAPARRFYAARGWREVDRGEDSAGEYLVLELSPGTLPAGSRSST